MYELVSCDLRKLADFQNVLLNQCGLDPSLPTLFLSECVLIYMTVAQSSALLQWVTQTFSTSYFVLYEQVEPNDSFGQTMLENLKARGCPLLSILEFPTLASQQKRLLDLQWDYVEVWNMESIWNDVVMRDKQEKLRVDSLEFLDEVEEWNLFNRHYFIALASHHPSARDENTDHIWKLQFKDLIVPIGPAKKVGVSTGRRILVD